MEETLSTFDFQLTSLSPDVENQRVNLPVQLTLRLAEQPTWAPHVQQDVEVQNLVRSF